MIVCRSAAIDLFEGDFKGYDHRLPRPAMRCGMNSAHRWRLNGSSIMKPVLDIKPVRVPARGIHCIEAGRGLQITAISGKVWLTQAKDRRDLILTRGQSFILDRKGRAVVYALEDAAIVVGPAGHITAADFVTDATWNRA